MTTPIDYARVRRILERHPPGDPCATYYLQREIEHEVVGPLVPDARALLLDAFEPGMHVLDLGCGWGGTLLASASRFRVATGVDDSVRPMLARAEADRRESGIRNVRFVGAKAVALPFADASVDLLFTERGPLGRQDATLVEALRLLRPGGLLFIETIGERNSWETVAAFDPGETIPRSWTANLENERDRLERHGLEVLTLASRVRKWRFPDFYEWLRFQCVCWNPPDRERLTVDCREEYERLVAIAGGPDGRIDITQHTIWLAGRKAG